MRTSGTRLRARWAENEGGSVEDGLGKRLSGMSVLTFWGESE